MASPLRGAAPGLLALFLMSGCNDMGRNSRQASRETQETLDVWVADVVAQPQSKDEVELTYSLAGISAQAFVRIDFSEDGGATYRESSVPALTLAVSRTPRRVSTSWHASMDISATAQHDLKIRVIPQVPGTRRVGHAAESEVFGLGPNSPPVVHFVAIGRPIAGGILPVALDISDAEGDHIRFKAELSVRGAAYRPASFVEAMGSHPMPADGSSTHIILHWKAQDDAPGISSAVAQLRVRAMDTASSEAVVTEPFELRTLAPSIKLLSLEGIEPEMNGSSTFTNLEGVEEAFRLQTPSSGFHLTVEASRAPGGAELDLESLEISSTTSLGRSRGVPHPEGSLDLGRFFVTGADPDCQNWLVPAAMKAPGGEVTVMASVADSLGNRSETTSFTFEVASRTGGAAPLEVEDNWVLEFHRDNFTITDSTDVSGRRVVGATEDPNGLPDYEEDLALVGLARPGSPAGSLEAVLSAWVVAWTKETVRGYVYRHFGREPDGSAQRDAANLRIHLTHPGGRVSRMAMGGDDPIPGFTIGRAEFDSGNSRRNNNTSVELGIFTTNIVEYHINTSHLFRSRFDPFTPGRGDPIGQDPLDRIVLGSEFMRSDPANLPEANRRHDAIVSAVDAWSRMVALVIAHEMGHSLGLVANGPPPRGLFGGERNALFAGPYTSAYHLDTVGANIMSAVLSFQDALLEGAEAPRFNPLSWAYLLGRIRLQ